MKDKIILKGCRENNLKNIDLEIPRNKFVVITGPSGSGKSSLAFDTLYKEGQRRYVESINTYGQQFLEQYQPPDIDLLEGLSPTIAIKAKRFSSNKRSTVATSSGLYDLLRILFANFGILKDPDSGEVIKSYSPSEVVHELLKNNLKTKIQVLAPIVTSDTRDLNSIINKYEKLGFSRIIYDNQITTFSDLNLKDINLASIRIIIDRIIIKEDIYRRLIDSVELAYKIGNGKIFVLCDEDEIIFCENNINPKTGQIFPKLKPKNFSYNRAEGACPSCNGVGTILSFEKDSLIFDQTLTIEDGAIYFLNNNNPYIFNLTLDYLKQNNLDKVTLNKFKEDEIKKLFFGDTNLYNFNFKSKNKKFELSDSKFPGILNWLNKNIDESNLKYEKNCPVCNNGKLNKFALSTFFEEKNIHKLCSMDINELFNFFKSHEQNHKKDQRIFTLYNQILYKIELLKNIGLDYLNLERKTSTLSGGETQRLNIATQLGSKLSGVLYILDEPTIGLHSCETPRLLDNINLLKNNGNSVLVVEHDLDIIKNCDYVIELGPKSGFQGGELIKSSPLDKFIKDNDSLTSQSLNLHKIKFKDSIREKKNFIEFTKVTENNLKSFDIMFPLNTLTTVTGISGSGKSSLVHHVLAKSCHHYLSKSTTPRKTNYNSVLGLDNINSLIEINSKPIGKSPNSVPATFLDIYKYIREVFAATNDSKIRGYTAKRFSFNVKGGRCDNCEGKGKVKLDMHFLADVWSICPICNGERFNVDTLSILFKSKTITEVLAMTAKEALRFFENHPKLSKTLSLMCDLDLSYIRLGQSSLQLSGGESQRLKIVKELSKRTLGHTLYLLDEPTSGLHSNEIQYLLEALNNLVDDGNTVIVIEHNLEVISQSDHIIDLGPEAGPNGGNLIFSGDPKDIVHNIRSKTGSELKKLI